MRRILPRAGFLPRTGFLPWTGLLPRADFRRERGFCRERGFGRGRVFCRERISVASGFSAASGFLPRTGFLPRADFCRERTSAADGFSARFSCFFIPRGGRTRHADFAKPQRPRTPSGRGRSLSKQREKCGAHRVRPAFYVFALFRGHARGKIILLRKIPPRPPPDLRGKARSLRATPFRPRRPVR